MFIERNETKPKEYFEMKNILSNSAIKVFFENRVKFYKKYVLNEIVEDEEDVKSVAMMLGTIVDFKLFNPEEDWDKHFHINSVQKPTGQMGVFVDVLYSKTLKYLDEENNITTDFLTIFQEAYDFVQKEGKFKGKSLEKVLEMFTSDGEGYYSECRNSFGKTVVDISLLTGAEKIIEDLKSSEFVGDIINNNFTGNTQVFDQLAVFYEVNGLKFKSLLDKVVVDHDNKMIIPYDLKVTYSSEGFPYTYNNMKYWIQAGVYQLALLNWAIQNEIDHYEIIPLSFIVADSSLKNKPVIYQTSKDSLKQALEGVSKPVFRKGVLQLINEIKWHLETGIWNYSKEAFENKGKLLILPYYNTED